MESSDVRQIRRKNTPSEKRKMRKERRKRKRLESEVSAQAVADTLKQERELRTKAQVEVWKYKRMSRSFWERWQWELQQRKEYLQAQKNYSRSFRSGSGITNTTILEIDPKHLLLPPSMQSVDECYIGRGSFGVVKVQLYRGISVAVKEALPRTLLADVRREASILAQFGHPHVPYLFGVSLRSRPYSIVMQYHGLSQHSISFTFSSALYDKQPRDDWFILIVQVIEGVRYLHEDANVLHNDFKCDNIIICDSFKNSSRSSPLVQFQALIVDFGKACTIDCAYKYCLSPVEIAEYTRLYTHMAPEVIEGVTCQTKNSDMFSVGGVLLAILDKTHDKVDHSSVLHSIASRCRSVKYLTRPPANEVLSELTELK